MTIGNSTETYPNYHIWFASTILWAVSATKQSSGVSATIFVFPFIGIESDCNRAVVDNTKA